MISYPEILGIFTAGKFLNDHILVDPSILSFLLHHKPRNVIIYQFS